MSMEFIMKGLIMKNKWYIFLIISYATFMCGFLNFNNFFSQTFGVLLLTLIASIFLFLICVVLFINLSSLTKAIYNKIRGFENSVIILFPFAFFNYTNHTKICTTFDITLLFNTFYPYNMLCEKNKDNTIIKDSIVKYEKESLFLERVLCACIYILLFVFGKYLWAISLLLLSLSLKEIRSINNELITGSIYRIEHYDSFEVDTIIVKQLCMYNYFDTPIYTEYVRQLSDNFLHNVYTVGSIEVVTLDLLSSGSDFFYKEYWNIICPTIIDDYNFGKDFTSPINNSLWALYRLLFVYAVINNDTTLTTRIINKIKVIKNNCVGAGASIMIQYLNNFLDKHDPNEIMHNLNRYIQLDKIYKKSPTGTMAISNIINQLKEVCENE